MCHVSVLILHLAVSTTVEKVERDDLVVGHNNVASKTKILSDNVAGLFICHVFTV